MLGVLGIVGLTGALAVGFADFTTLYRVSVGATVSQVVVGHDRHSYALALLAVAAVALLVFATRGSEPAALAVTAIAVVALIVGPIADRHAVTSPGVLGQLYDNATAQSGLGYHLELVGAIVLLVAGGALLGVAPPGVLARLRRSGDTGRQTGR